MDLAALNMIRERQGLEPLDKLPENVNQEPTENINDETVVANDKTTETPAADTPAATSPVKEEKKVTPPAEIVQPKLSVDELLALLKEQGHEVNLNATKETPEEAQARREADKLAWAYANKKISAKEHAGYNADSRDVQNLCYREYLAEQKAEDPSLTDADILDEFQTKYGINADPDSRQFKTGQKQLERLGNDLLKEKYPNVFELENNYSQYESGENTRKAQEDKIRQESPKYKSAIEDIFTKDLASYSLKVGEVEYSIPFPEDVVNGIKAHYFDPKEAIKYISQGLSRETLAMSAKMAVIEASLPVMLENFGKQYKDNYVKGIKGITTDINPPVKTKIPLTEGQLIAIRRNNPAYVEQN